MTLRCHRAESVVRPKVKYKVVVILTNVTEGPLDSISSKGTEASSIFWPHTMTGMRWWATIGSSGLFWRGSWDGKEQARGCRGPSSRGWCRRFFSLGQRCGWWPPAWAGPWGGSSIGWLDGSRDGNLGGVPLPDGSTPPWGKWCGRLAWRRLRHTSWGGRIRSRSTLRRDRFWTSARRRCGGQGCGSQKGGGNKRGWTWRGRRHWKENQTWRPEWWAGGSRELMRDDYVAL